MLTLRTLFDSKFYLENNPDVAVAVARGTVSSPFDHYRKIGKFENRDPNALFDSSYYLDTNTDVAVAAKLNDVSVADTLSDTVNLNDATPTLSSMLVFI